MGAKNAGKWERTESRTWTSDSSTEKRGPLQSVWHNRYCEPGESTYLCTHTVLGYPKILAHAARNGWVTDSPTVPLASQEAPVSPRKLNKRLGVAKELWAPPKLFLEGRLTEASICDTTNAKTSGRRGAASKNERVVSAESICHFWTSTPSLAGRRSRGFLF